VIVLCTKKKWAKEETTKQEKTREAAQQAEENMTANKV
jgi:hypothetical protein